MNALRFWTTASWIALPTVMFGGYSLLRLLNRGDALTAFQVRCFRAGHAHAGVLLVMSLSFYSALAQTALSPELKRGVCLALFVGILLQSGGFFLHMATGRDGQASIGTHITVAGAAVLAMAVGILVYGLITTKSSP
jgi:heme/copper-type cytochrome/quinol oxidase subunit 4